MNFLLVPQAVPLLGRKQPLEGYHARLPSICLERKGMGLGNKLPSGSTTVCPHLLSVLQGNGSGV